MAKKRIAQPEGVRSVEETLAGTKNAGDVAPARLPTKGVTIKREGEFIVIRIPFNKKPDSYPVGESGKSRWIGSTSGWLKNPFGDDERLSVTAAAIHIIPKNERKK